MNVNDQIENNGENRNHHHRAHDKGIVTVDRRINEIAANAWNLEISSPQ